MNKMAKRPTPDHFRSHGTHKSEPLFMRVAPPFCMAPCTTVSVSTLYLSRSPYLIQSLPTTSPSMAGRRSLCLLNPPPLLLLLLLLSEGNWGGRALRLNRWDPKIWMPTEKVEPEEDSQETGTRWAVLVAGSYGYGNYRHQVGFFFYSRNEYEFGL